MEKILLIFLCVVCVNGGMAGGWSEVKDLNSPSIQNVARNATRMLASKMNSEYHLKMMNLMSARKQVVSGMNYKLELQIQSTECKKNQNYSEQELENCPVKNCGSPNHCTITAWDRPWMEDGFKVTNYECDSDSFC